MAKSDLDVEHEALLREHDLLVEAHHALHNRPYDIDAHRKHRRQLHDHRERLHRYMAERRFSPQLAGHEAALNTIRNSSSSKLRLVGEFKPTFTGCSRCPAVPQARDSVADVVDAAQPARLRHTSGNRTVDRSPE